jgi:hypothetical protein
MKICKFFVHNKVSYYSSWKYTLVQLRNCVLTHQQTVYSKYINWISRKTVIQYILNHHIPNFVLPIGSNWQLQTFFLISLCRYASVKQQIYLFCSNKNCFEWKDSATWQLNGVHRNSFYQSHVLQNPSLYKYCVGPSFPELRKLASVFWIL